MIVTFTSVTFSKSSFNMIVIQSQEWKHNSNLLQTLTVLLGIVTEQVTQEEWEWPSEANQRRGGHGRGTGRAIAMENVTSLQYYRIHTIDSHQMLKKTFRLLLAFPVQRLLAALIRCTHDNNPSHMVRLLTREYTTKFTNNFSYVVHELCHVSCSLTSLSRGVV